MVEVLTQAIEKGGSSISDYVDADGRRGFFQFEHRVYQRTGEPCVNCGAPIRRTLVAQRGTHYCPKCQRRLEEPPRRASRRLQRSQWPQPPHPCDTRASTTRQAAP